MYFFVDLDGTLLDVSEKFYRSYFDLVTAEGHRALPKDVYWELKRSGQKESIILSQTDAIVNQFTQRRKAIIESTSYQQHDALCDGAIEFLTFLKSHGTVVLVTLRHNPTQLHLQLHNLGVAHFFNEILSIDPDYPTPKNEIKAQLIQKHFSSQNFTHSFFIGDTETDVWAGQRLGITTVALTHGMRTEMHLRSLAPTALCADLYKATQEIQSLIHQGQG
jgi:phosphoglycolate phosphatase-like HAD superfamily hydrolase